MKDLYIVKVDTIKILKYLDINSEEKRCDNFKD
uniref:Uncharacterized protein n=1 Tax=viral metagenome TaxID=1070528 RepID=A0A6C0AEK4_9ZZZZ